MRRILFSLFLLVTLSSTVTYADNTLKVGTPNGDFSVSPLGGALYSIAIECPPGINGMEPRLSLTYNSHSGYGLAGYGVTVSGISSITRAPLNTFYDGYVQGMKFNNSDALYLDGKRLIPKYGNISGSYFTVEGDPYTEVTRHGTCTSTTDSTWFEVKDRNGMTYRYGETSDSRLIYTNKNYVQRVYSWYINCAEDANTNYITYTYSRSNNYVRPTTVSYGMNRVAGRNSRLNSIDFEYETLGNDACSFAIEDTNVAIDFRIKRITTKTLLTTYRSYELGYATNSDASYGKFTRLTTVTEKNRDGAAKNPVVFGWQPLPSAMPQQSSLGLSLDDSDPQIGSLGRRLLGADVNGDGTDDIIRVSPVAIHRYGGVTYDTYLYIYESHVDQYGTVTFDEPYHYSLDISTGVTILGGKFQIDFDDDGCTDLLIPYYFDYNGARKVGFRILHGNRIYQGFGHHQTSLLSRELVNSSSTALFSVIDANGDGKDDIAYLENTSATGYYPLRIIPDFNAPDTSGDQVHFLDIAYTPKRLFVADFNNDGVKDIIVFHESGYKIFYNQGSHYPYNQFNTVNTASGTNVKDSWLMETGDFNGDGLTDFLVNEQGQTTLKFAINKGDGTFEYTVAADTGLKDRHFSMDDDRFTLLVSDFDQDGKSDALVIKANYSLQGLVDGGSIYTGTSVRWLHSDGNILSLDRSVETKGEDDALAGHLALGNFSGNGCMDILNYGNSLTESSNTDSPSLHLSRTGVRTASQGRVSSVTDGMGRKQDIGYSFLTNPAVYQEDSTNTVSVKASAIPISVVSERTISNGAAGTMTESYRYKDLCIHGGGKGVLGFAYMAAENASIGELSVNRIVQWDTVRWTPSLTVSEKTRGNATSSVETACSVIAAFGNYRPCPQAITETDQHGNVCTTTLAYDTANGVLTEKTTLQDSGAYYVRESFSGYTPRGQRFLPQIIVRTAKHPDDPSEYSTTTTCQYDSCGRVASTTEFSGTSMALTTACTYDAFGNITSRTSSGSGVTQVTEQRTYTTDGRFVSKVTTSPEAVEKSFVYNGDGNVTFSSEYDKGIRYTAYSYDSWGSLLFSVNIDNDTTTYEEGWGPSASRRYYKKMSVRGRPWQKVWYDECGREVLRESVGEGCMPISKSTEYNSIGYVAHVTSTAGELTVAEDYAYDTQGRVISRNSSNGHSESYNYGNRSLTVNVNGSPVMKTFDAWGNVSTSQDAVSSVNYTYSSCGLPSAVSSEGAEVSLLYDQAKHRTALYDPDAGNITSTYSADGKTLTQTDARGFTRTYTYNGLGQPLSWSVGGHTAAFTYGESKSTRTLPKTMSLDGNTLSYIYDARGRVNYETRSISGGGSLYSSYSYNSHGQPVQTVYPGGFTVGYAYDDYGFCTAMTVNGQEVFSMKYADGQRDSVTLCGTAACTTTRDANGMLATQTWYANGTKLKNCTYCFNGATGNLTSRVLRRKIFDGPIINPSGLDNGSASTQSEIIVNPGGGGLYEGRPVTETFYYDGIDRLVNERTTCQLSPTTNEYVAYSSNGNIASKSSVGSYTYDDNGKPHAIASVSNPNGIIPQAGLTTAFNEFGMIASIEQGDTTTIFYYGPDMERWRTVTEYDGSTVRAQYSMAKTTNRSRRTA